MIDLRTILTVIFEEKKEEKPKLNEFDFNIFSVRFKMCMKI